MTTHSRKDSQTNKKKQERVAAAYARADRLGDPGKGVVEPKGSWYDSPRVAVIVSIAAFALSVIPAWYPIVVSWRSPNFVGTVVEAFNNQSTDEFLISTWDGSTRVCVVPFDIIQLTNNSSHRLGISGFKMERKLSSGKWETLRPAILLDPFLVETQLRSLAFVPIFLDFSKNYFDRLAVSKTLEPGDSMFGWTFIKGKPVQFLPLKSRWWPPAALWSSLIGANEVRLVIYDTLGDVTKLDVSTVPAQDPRVSLAALKDLMLVSPELQFWAHAKVKCED